MDVGGIETTVMNYYRNIDRSKLQFDFLLHCKHKSFFEDEIEALGGKIYRVPSYHPSEQIKYRAALKRFFAEHTEYRVVHSHIGCYGVYVLRAAKRAGVPMRIAHSHTSYKFWKLNKTLPFRALTRLGLGRQYTHVFACSPEAAEFIAPGKPYTLMSNAVNVCAFAFNLSERERIRAELGVKDEPIVGHVGRFHPAKNHTFLLDAFAEVLRLEPRAKLLLVGGGALLNDMKSKAERLGIAESLIFAGVRSDTPALLSAMDAFAFPSHYEGFPVSLLEAQCSGLPCVISDTIPQSATVNDNVTALSLTAPARLWAEAIVKCLSEKRRDNSTERITAAGYDIKTNAAKLQDFYTEAYRHGTSKHTDTDGVYTDI